MTPIDHESLDKFHKMYVDMYIGEGKDNPPMTTRMALAEDRLERMGKNLNKALWLAVSTLLALAGEIIARLVPHL